MREADVAIRLRRPTQPDLIQRRLFTVHFHVYASPDYIKRFGEPKTPRGHRQAPHRRLRREPALLPEEVHWLSTAGRDGAGAPALPFRRQQHHRPEDRGRDRRRASACCPTTRSTARRTSRQILRDVEMPSLDSYLVYAEEMRSVARVQAFRDFLVAKAQRWTF